MQATLFGTDGIRKKMGTEPLTPTSLMQLGNAIGHWATQEYGSDNIIMGHDTRNSSSLVIASLKAGLFQHKLTVTDAYVIPTPVLFNTVMNASFEIGIMITASHNPYHDNGIKIFTKKHGKITQEQELEISRLFHELPPCSSYENLGTEASGSGFYNFYAELLKTMFPPNFLKDVTVAIDCANGASYSLAPKILQDFGANVMTIGNSPNGKNINAKCGSLHPEMLQSMVPSFEANIGFAFDGDGDRIIVVDKHGTIRDGDEIIALLLKNPAYIAEKKAVGTIMTNQGLESYLSNYHIDLIRTPVGDKNVLTAMRQEDCLVGGEPSGHIILRDGLETSDALFTCLRILETLLLQKTWNCDVFKKFPQVSINVPVKLKKDLTTQPYAQLIQKHKEQLPNGRFVVRYSGTEPVLRVMVEDPDKNSAEQAGTLLSQELAQNLAKEKE